jgi:hypothetical protein
MRPLHQSGLVSSMISIVSPLANVRSLGSYGVFVAYVSVQTNVTKISQRTSLFVLYPQRARAYTAPVSSTVIVGGGTDRAGKAGTGGTALRGLEGGSCTLAAMEGSATAPGVGSLPEAVARRAGRGGTTRPGDGLLDRVEVSGRRDKIVSAFDLVKQFCSTRNATLF